MQTKNSDGRSFHVIDAILITTIATSGLMINDKATYFPKMNSSRLACAVTGRQSAFQ